MYRIFNKFLIPSLTVLLVVTVNIETLSAQQVTTTTTTMMVEPARWTQQDVTIQQRYSTAFKEATNAQQQSIEECKVLNTIQRNSCIADARMAYKQDMAAIQLKFKK